MAKSKNKIRITTILIILTLVLIPLLSSNVSALVTWSAGNGWTNNTPGGPTVGGAISAPAVVTDPAPTVLANVIFTFGYTFTDTDPAGSGSWHRVIMVVAPGSTTVTGPVFLAAGTALVVGVHTSPTYTNVRGTTYTITVTVDCWPAGGPPPIAWWTGMTTCTVN